MIKAPTKMQPSIAVENREIMNRKDILNHRAKYWRFSRVQDVTISLLGLAVRWPLMLLAVRLIVIDNPGAGPIYIQDRVGRDGKVFKFYKWGKIPA